MAWAAGNFIANGYRSQKEMASKMWADDGYNKDWKHPSLMWNDLIGNEQAIKVPVTDEGQVISRKVLTNNRFCGVHEIYFLQSAKFADDGALAGDNTDCEIVGTAIGSDKKEYSTNQLFRPTAMVPSYKCQSLIDYQELWATTYEYLKSTADLESEKDLIAAIVGFKKALPASYVPKTGTRNGGTGAWDVPAASVKAEFIAEIIMAAKIMRMTNPVLVSGTAWYLERALANAQSGGGCCNYNALLSQAGLKNVHNIVDFDTIAGANKFYLIDMANIGYVNASENNNANPTSTTSDMFGWTDSSRNLFWKNGAARPSLNYDIRMQRKCSGGSIHEFEDHLEAKHTGAFFEAPQDLQAAEYPNCVEFNIT